MKDFEGLLLILNAKSEVLPIFSIHYNLSNLKSMRKIKLIVGSLLLLVLGSSTALAQLNVTVYRPNQQVTTLNEGTSYLIYNTKSDRPGFIGSTGTGMAHSGTVNTASTYATISENFIWQVTAAGETDAYYLKNVGANKYVTATGAHRSAADTKIFIQDWYTTLCPKATGEILTRDKNGNTSNAKAISATGSGVWTINGPTANGTDCWNGNSGSWVKWSNGHPYAFYTYTTSTINQPSFPGPGIRYFIYCDNDERQYFYNDNGTLKVASTISGNVDRYLFECTFDGTYHQFRNISNGKYFGWKAFASSPYNYLIEDGAPSGQAVHMKGGNSYLVMKYDGKFDQSSHANYLKGSSDYSANYYFVPAGPILRVEGNSQAGASVTWNGETQTIPAAYALKDVTVTDATLSVASYDEENFSFNGFSLNGVSQGNSVEFQVSESDVTYISEFLPNFFSTTYGEKWLRIRNSRYPEYGFALNNATPAANQNIKTEKIDLSSDNYLWCFVGTPKNFKIYNKKSESLVIGYDDSPASGEAVTFQTADEGSTAQSWKLVDYTTINTTNSVSGYSFVPTSDSENALGLNPYAGVGNLLKFYENSDGGNRWLVEEIDMTKSLSLTVQVSGVIAPNTNIASLNITAGGVTTAKPITGAVSTQLLYFPKNTSVNISSTTTRGYDWSLSIDGAASVYSVDGLDFSESNTHSLDVSYSKTDERVLYTTPDANNKPYRIPAIVTALNGDIFAISDNRPCGNDVGYGEVDIKCRISTDHGQTWGDEFFVANGTGIEAAEGQRRVDFDYAFGDAAVVADCERNEILLLCVCGKTPCNASATEYTLDENTTNPNRVALVRAKLVDGQWEWSAPIEVTERFYQLFVKNNTEVTVTSLFVGSGRIMQSRKVRVGDYYRIYAALWTKNSGNRVVYSDDFGETWHILGSVDDRPATAGNEPKCEELPDGTVVLSSRHPNGRCFNLFTYTDETYQSGSWGEMKKSFEVANGLTNTDSGTNGEILFVDNVKNTETGNTASIMLQSVPLGSGRNNLAVWTKEISGSNYTTTSICQDWTMTKQVSYKASAYSAMTLQQDGRIGMLFEEAPNQYCIVYKPMTISDITGGRYTASDEININAAVAVANKVLEKSGVGYPTNTATSRSTLEDVITTQQNNTSATATDRINAINSAITTYKQSTTEIQLPEDGKAYTIANLNKFGVKRYMKYTDNSTEITFGATTKADASVFICRQLENGKYAFVTPDGNFLVWRGSEGANDHKGFVGSFDFESDNKSDWTQIAIAKMTKGGNVSGSQEALFGYVTFSGRRSSTYATGYTVLTTSGSYDNSNAPFFNDNHTSALLFEDATATNSVKLNAVSADDELISGIDPGMTISTFSAPYATVAPSGVTAYAALLNAEQNGATMQAVSGAIPAGAGVVLIGEMENIQSRMLPATTETAADLSGNLLVGTANATHTVESGDYILVKGSSGIGFYKAKVGSQIGKGKAYLHITSEQAVRGFKLQFGEGSATAIQTINSIDETAPIYDLTGRRVNQLHKGGIYIQSGRKFIVK